MPPHQMRHISPVPALPSPTSPANLGSTPIRNHFFYIIADACYILQTPQSWWHTLLGNHLSSSLQEQGGVTLSQALKLADASTCTPALCAAIGKLWAQSPHWESHGSGSVEPGKHFWPCIALCLCRWIFVTLTKASDSQDEGCTEDIQPVGTFHCPFPPLESREERVPTSSYTLLLKAAPSPTQLCAALPAWSTAHTHHISLAGADTWFCGFRVMPQTLQAAEKRQMLCEPLTSD